MGSGRVPRLRPALGGLCDAAASVEAQLEPVGQLLARFADRAVLQFHDQVQDVSAAAFAEAVEDVLVRVDVEARAVLAAVDGASPDELAGLLLAKPVQNAVARQDVVYRHLALQLGEVDPAGRHIVPSYLLWLWITGGS